MKNKKNFLFALIGAGTLVLSAGVGFAAWTINAKNTETGKADITISADGTVNDNRIKLSDASGFEEQFSSISFGAGTIAEKTPWLIGSTDSKEQLTLKYNVVVTGGENLKVKVSKAEVIDENKEQKFTNLTGKDNTKKIFGALPSTTNIYLSEEQTSKGTYKGTIELEFTWGEAFGGVNPYTYYNNQDFSDPLADEAKENIGKLKDVENYTGLKLSFSVAVE